ncbi:hypothetical protein [Rhizobium leguminosarum]|uniref:hypothetical protein n=1 Tax=Rhizobium leguminosarum TaxID=384 RepID=UPI001C96A0C4|nr:hypothetical protein [Rhizobium leguminosarum]MBY5708869.1 sel1 repeat family protein [Rhizobium leguminosarum]
MPEFQNPFFVSASEEVEAEYIAGLGALQRGDCNAASRHFGNAARGGHVSALFNLSLLWGGGSVTPYDFDLAADYWYKAAEAGHPRAKAALWHLEAADRGGYGADNLANFAQQADPGGGLIPSTMICAARFYDVICRKYGATVDVIAYELDAAAKSDFDFVHSFIQRTGVDKDFYQGGLDRIKPGSAADQITDGLNKLHVAMKRSGVSDRLAVMARCSIVGHVIAKSPYGDRSQPLRGVDTFFADSQKDSEMFSIFGKRENDNPKPPQNFEELQELIKLLGKEVAGKLIRSGAMSGNVFCQVLLSQGGLSISPENKNSEIQRDIELFTEMAAKSGDAGSQFNLGKLHLEKVDAEAEYLNHSDIVNIKKAKYWFGMAASQGMSQAREMLKQLEVFNFD